MSSYNIKPPSKDDLKKKGLIKSKMRNCEVERVSVGCTGVKRTTGQHPGGIVVVPDYRDVYDFTPFQYPANDNTVPWRTTHFDYHAIDQDLLKLDILGHDDPTVLRMLQDLSKEEINKGKDKNLFPLNEDGEVDITYVSSNGVAFPLVATNFYIKDASIHEYEWNPEVTKFRYGDFVKMFTKESLKYDVTLAFNGSLSQKEGMLKEFHDEIERDIMTENAGKLTYNGYEISCFFINSTAL